MSRRRVIIMGAAGRDFHNFNIRFRDDPAYRVVAFTAAQIPYITNRRYPPALAGRLYPAGIPIFDEAELPRLIAHCRVETVVFAYSDLSHEELMHKASLVLAAGADFKLLGPNSTMLAGQRPVISVCAVRTGSGKSQVTGYLCDVIKGEGMRPVVVRHPMPYGDLARQVAVRFAGMGDLDINRCTIEEREEFEPLLARGVVVYAGVDYRKILHAAEGEGEIIVWDGGNNDFPFFRPDLEITLVDPLRPGHETAYFPGEVNLRRARVVVINKANAARAETILRIRGTVAAINPGAEIVETASEIRVDDPAAVAGKRVLVVEDGPTITHGGMPSGAGYAAALRYSAAEIVDPRPHAAGSIRRVFEAYPHIGPVLPAMGYSPEQIEELRQTIELVPCDLVLSATPVDLARVMTVSRPVARVHYDLREGEGRPLAAIVRRFLPGAASHP